MDVPTASPSSRTRNFCGIAGICSRQRVALETQLLAAAQALHDPEQGVYGIVGMASVDRLGQTIATYTPPMEAGFSTKQVIPNWIQR